MQPTLSIGLKAARAASEQVFRSLDKLDIVKNDSENIADFITEVAQATERTVAYNLHKAHPEHQVIGLHSGIIEAREGNGASTGSDYVWHINPISGLNNYAHNLPFFAFCLICKVKGRTEHAVIINPLTSEELTTSRGGGAQLNGRRIRVNGLTELDSALILQEGGDKTESYLKLYQHIADKGSRIQSYGSAALALAYTAAGRVDSSCCQGGEATELEAGALLVQEAGGLLGDLKGGNPNLTTGDLIAGNPKLFKLLLQAIRPAL